MSALSKWTAFLAMALLVVGSLAHATTYTWDNDGSDGVWTDTTRWDPNTGYPNAEGDIAQITDSESLTYTITLDTSVSIAGFLKSSGTHYGIVTIAADGAHTITLDTIGGVEGNISSRVGTLYVGPDIILADSVYFDGFAARLEIHGAITGTGNIRAYNATSTSARGCVFNGDVNVEGTIATIAGNGLVRFNGLLGDKIASLTAEASNTELNNAGLFIGPTFLNRGMLKLNSPSGNALSSELVCVTGGGTINSVLLWQRSDQISDMATIKVVNGQSTASLNLGSRTDTVNMLFLDGVGQLKGTYGSSASTATYKDDTYFTPNTTGILTVLTSPPVGTVFVVK